MSCRAMILDSQPPIIRPRVALEIKVVDLVSRRMGAYVSLACFIPALKQAHARNGGSFLRDGGRWLLRWRHG